MNEPPYHHIQLKGKFARRVDGNYADLQNQNKRGFGHSELSIDEQIYFVGEVQRIAELARSEGWKFVIFRFISR